MGTEQQVAHTPGPWRIETEHYQGDAAEPMEWEQPRILWTGWDEKEKRQRYTRASFNSCGYIRESAARAMADARLLVVAPKLLKALEALFGHLEAGNLVRDTSGDAEPGWAMKQAPLVRDLASGAAAIAEARGREAGS